MKYVLIHGWKSQGEGMEALANELIRRGHKVEYFSYGYTLGLFSTIFKTKAAAEILANKFKRGEDGDAILVGHSNGCNVIARAAKIAKIQNQVFPTNAIYIAPALNCNTPSHALENIDVFHSEHDSAVKFATFIPFSKWGRMGANGHTGEDDAYLNHDMSGDIDGHSDYFNKIGFTADRIEQVS